MKTEVQVSLAEHRKDETIRVLYTMTRNFDTVADAEKALELVTTMMDMGQADNKAILTRLLA